MPETLHTCTETCVILFPIISQNPKQHSHLNTSQTHANSAESLRQIWPCISVLKIMLFTLGPHDFQQSEAGMKGLSGDTIKMSSIIKKTFPFESGACSAGTSNGVRLLLRLWKRRGQKREFLTSDGSQQQSWDCSLSR